MRFLLVEDDLDLHRILTKRLEEEGHLVDDCYDGEEGLTYAESTPYDCVILDWLLPKRDGISVLKTLREQGNEQPVLMLTAKDAISDRVIGLDAGADDYLVKPFAFEELMARIRALMRRSSEAKGAILQISDLVMDTAEHTVRRGEQEILLTSREYAILEYLLRNQGHIQTRTQIADHAWNCEFDCESNVVDVYIRYLRNKIDRNRPVKLIQTVRGFGYVLRVEHD